MLAAGWSLGNVVDTVFHVPENPWLVIVKFSLLSFCLAFSCGLLTFFLRRRMVVAARRAGTRPAF